MIKKPVAEKTKGQKMEKQPEITAMDGVHSTVKAIISTIPVVSGPLDIIFEEVFRKPIEKRREKWLQELADVVEELKENKKCHFDKLSENENFISAVLQASTIALRTNQEEKIKALRNAIQNSALFSTSEDKQTIFLRFVDEFTVWHITVLDLFSNPAEWCKKNGKEISITGLTKRLNFLEKIFPEIVQSDFFSFILIDLKNKGLLKDFEFIGGEKDDITTDLGKEFLRFIRKSI